MSPNRQKRTSHSFKCHTSTSPLFEWLHTEALFIAGICFWLIILTIYLYSGGQCVVAIHDHVDSPDMTVFILESYYPNEFPWPAFLGGAWAPLSLHSAGSMLFYSTLSIMDAYKANACFTVLFAYIGCWMCEREIGIRPWISALFAFVFSALPFYTEYGLSVMGMPILVWAYLRLKDANRSPVLGVLAVLVYALFSSFAYIGFAIVAITFVLLVCNLCKRHYRVAARILVCLLVLLVIYLIFNWALIAPALGIEEAPTSHRTLWQQEYEPFSIWDSLDFFLNGHYHAISNHRWELLIIAGGCIAGLVNKDSSNSEKRYLSAVFFILLTAVLIALFQELWTSTPGALLRSLLPKSLQTFQFNRIFWLYPTLFTLGTALSADIIIQCASNSFQRVLSISAIVFIAFASFWMSAPSNPLFQTAKSQITGEKPSKYVTWNEFFAPELFERISEDLAAKEGRSQDNYYVGSIGLFPTIALYNGFQTIDGYAPTYDVNYHNRFRAVIEGELAKSEDLRDYYDNWGNRVYLFSHELGRNYLVRKDSDKKIVDLRLNIESFKELGGRYVFSAVEIVNAKASGLQLVDVYESDGAIYDVWVYEAE